MVGIFHNDIFVPVGRSPGDDHLVGIPPDSHEDDKREWDEVEEVGREEVGGDDDEEGEDGGDNDEDVGGERDCGVK